MLLIFLPNTQRYLSYRFYCDNWNCFYCGHNYVHNFSPPIKWKRKSFSVTAIIPWCEKLESFLCVGSLRNNPHATIVKTSLSNVLFACTNTDTLRVTASGRETCTQFVFRGFECFEHSFGYENLFQSCCAD